MFIIDFDDTLFNTQAFKEARAAAVRELGVPEALFWSSYQEARKSSDGLWTYSNERHAAVLERHGFDRLEMLRALESTTGDRLKTFLFADAMRFLTSIQSFGEPMVLLSLGDPAHQEQKVRGAGVHDFFDRTFMVDETKVDVMKTVIAHETDESVIWFINDKIGETEEIRVMSPLVRPILKISPQFSREAYEASGMPFFSTLTEIEAYVRTQR